MKSYTHSVSENVLMQKDDKCQVCDWSGRSLVSLLYHLMIFPDWAFFVARDPTSVVEGGDGGNPLRGAAAAAAALYFGPSPTSNPPHPFPPHPSPSIHSAPSPSEGNLKKV